MHSMNCIVILVVHIYCFSFCNGWILHAKSLCKEMNDDSPVVKNITITYTIRNTFSEPWYVYERNVTSSDGQPFIRFMEQAADDDTNYKFSTTYDSKHGYVILGLGKEGQCGGSSLTSWQFKKGPSTILSTDVSRYIPEDGDHLIMDCVMAVL
uniref:Uncharacterized protein n=1 Tax=Magallana gigas TaxID=29159 RepID=A0A8W8KNE4_MAGGI|nr:uncharacterized protein LOC105327471 [Crassostrea gigas]